MAYRYLGYGITNEQGIATLDHDANGDLITHSYTGTGAGEIDIVASLDDNTHISERSIQSRTYPVWDTLCYDIATTGKKSSAWSNPDGISIVTNDDGTTLSDVANYYSSTNTMTGDFRLEFEIKTTGGVGRFGVYTSNLSKSSHVNITENDWVHFRITRQNGVVTFERSTDGVTWITGTWGSNTLTTETCGFKFYNLATNRTISYRNMKCYAI
jgi:hypothetical protein